MKPILNKLFVFASALLIISASSIAWASDATVTNIQGEVLVARQATPENWETITADTPLESGDVIKTRNGSCALTYSDQATFAVDPNSQVGILDNPETQDLNLVIGNIRGKVNKEKAMKPFQVITPAAVAAIRGTEVDFGYNDQGEMTVDLHAGNIQVLNDDAALTLDLDGNKQIKVKFDKGTNSILVKNECGSDGPLTFSVLGTQYTNNPCDEQVIDLATSESGNDVPGNITQGSTENPDEGREPISPNQP